MSMWAQRRLALMVVSGMALWIWLGSTAVGASGAP